MSTLRGYLSNQLHPMGFTHPVAEMIAMGLVKITSRGRTGGGTGSERGGVALEMVIPTTTIEMNEHRSWGNAEVRRVTLLGVDHEPFHTEGRNLAEVLKQLQKALGARHAPPSGMHGWSSARRIRAAGAVCRCVAYAMCPFCSSMTEEEASAYTGGGMRALEALWREHDLLTPTSWPAPSPSGTDIEALRSRFRVKT